MELQLTFDSVLSLSFVQQAQAASRARGGKGAALDAVRAECAAHAAKLEAQLAATLRRDRAASEARQTRKHAKTQLLVYDPLPLHVVCGGC